MADPFANAAAFLAQYLSQPLATPKNRNNDLAKFILLNHTKGVQAPVALSSKKTGDDGGPGFLSRVIDVLSRPNYAIAEGVRNLNEAITTDDENPLGAVLGGAWQGLKGKEKTTFSDVIQEAEQMDIAEETLGDRGRFKEVKADVNPIGKFGGGLVADIFLDPTTYLGVGAVSKLGRAAGLGKKVKEADQLTKAQRLAEPAPVAEAPFKLEQPGPLESLRITPDPAAAKPTKFQIGKNRQVLSDAAISTRPPIRLPEAELASPVTQTAKPDIQGLLSRLGTQAPDPLTNPLTRKPPVAKAFESIEQGRQLKNAENIVDEVAQGSIQAAAHAAPKAKPDPRLSEIHSDLPNRVNDIAAGVADDIRLNRSRAKNTVFDPTSVNRYEQAKLFRKAREVAEETIRTVKNIRNPQASRFNKLRADYTYRILIGAEETLKNLGHRPASGVWLSDVLAEVGGHPQFLFEDQAELIKAVSTGNYSKLRNPEFRQAIENVKARSAMEDAPKLDAAVGSVLHVADSIFDDNFISQAQQKHLHNTLKKKTATVISGSGVTEVGAKAGDNLVKSLLDDMYSKPQRVLDRKAIVINAILAKGKHGRDGAEVNHALTRALTEEITGDPKELSKIIGEGNNANSWFMSRMATWYGKKDLQPEVLNTIGSARAAASMRGRVTKAMLEGTSKEQRLEAWRVAQGLVEPSDEIVSRTADIFRRQMENLFRSTGVDKIAGANSVITRSGILLTEINRHLRNYKVDAQFGKKIVKGVDGSTRDYSKGADWLKSWETWDINEDPATFFFKVESAVEQAAREKALFDEIGERWGSILPKGEYRIKVKHPYLDGYHFSRDIAEQVQHVIKDMQNFYDVSSPVLRLFDRVTSAWKTGVTIYAPSHHIRNAIGDTYLAWMDGVNSVVPYNLARKVVHTQRAKYAAAISDPSLMEPLIEIGAIPKAFAKIPSPSDVLFVTKGGIPITAERVYISAFNKGLLQHAHTIEDIFGEPLMKNFKPLGGKAQAVARSAAELREHWIRLAHFIDLLRKSSSKDVSTIIDDAAARVRKWHPDGLDLTDFERSTLRRVMPFYSWTRKAIPLIVEGAVMNPGKTLVYPKGMYGVQGMMGVESEAPSDPFPTDQMFPDWIKHKGIGPITAPDAAGGVGGLINSITRNGPEGEEGYGIVNPSNPALDLAAQFSNPGKGLGGMLTPAIKVPVELMQGRRMLTGEPIEGQTSEYLTEQVPIASLIQRLTNMSPTGPTVRGEKEGLGNIEALINYLTAAGVVGTAPYIKSAEFEARERARRAAQG